MKSPRFGESQVHQGKNRFGWLVALAAVLIAAPCRAQSTGVAAPDSAVAVPPDSAGTDSAAAATAGADSAGAANARADSAGVDSAGADSAAVAPGDSLGRSGLDSITPPPSPASPPATVDSALGAVCEETAHGPPDVYLVTFRRSATESERSAVAKEVGGTLLGMSEHAAPGSWYLRVPGSAGDPAVADRLILLPPVLEVGSTRCPS
jgi:hypothetical protein